MTLRHIGGREDWYVEERMRERMVGFDEFRSAVEEHFRFDDLTEIMPAVAWIYGRYNISVDAPYEDDDR